MQEFYLGMKQKHKRHTFHYKIAYDDTYESDTLQGQKNKSKKVKSGKAAPDQAPSSSEKSLGYFKDIEADKIRQLYKHYKYDFEIFDYSAEEYFEL